MPGAGDNHIIRVESIYPDRELINRSERVSGRSGPPVAVVVRSEGSRGLYGGLERCARTASLVWWTRQTGRRASGVVRPLGLR
eukprot:2810705-Pyramimonas_sp.AAC.2